MINWLTYEVGCWINGVKWHPEGSVSIDPSAIEAVGDAHLKNPERCCVINTSTTAYCVMRSRAEVIADIQSALP